MRFISKLPEKTFKVQMQKKQTQIFKKRNDQKNMPSLYAIDGENCKGLLSCLG